MSSKDENESEEEYDEQIDLSENELYQVGSVFFENEDGDNISNILTNLTKVQIALVDSQQELIKEQKAQTTSMQNIVKMLQKINKNLMKDDK
tara:strand:- start:754 stop:1029 length:276 start_codon:yes stop_codon:yes gene_type:complete